MKKTIKVWMTLSILIIVSMSVNAQVGIEAGYVNSTFQSSPDEGDDMGGYNGFRLGVTYNIGLVSGLSLQTGFHYSYIVRSESDNFNEPGLEVEIKMSHKEHNVDVPLHFAYTFPVTNSFKLFAFAGPKLVMGVSSKMKTEWAMNLSLLGEAIRANADYTYNYYNEEWSISASDEEIKDLIEAEIDGGMGKFSRFDVQLGLGIGAVIQDRFLIKGGYDWGLLDRLTGEDAEHYSLRRNQFYIGIGYQF